jgi:hypothetical protein
MRPGSSGSAMFPGICEVAEIAVELVGSAHIDDDRCGRLREPLGKNAGFDPRNLVRLVVTVRRGRSGAQPPPGPDGRGNPSDFTPPVVAAPISRHGRPSLVRAMRQAAAGPLPKSAGALHAHGRKADSPWTLQDALPRETPRSTQIDLITAFRMHHRRARGLGNRVVVQSFGIEGAGHFLEIGRLLTYHGRRLRALLQRDLIG